MKILKNKPILLNLGYISHFSVDFYSSFLIPLLPLISKNFNLSLFAVSIMMSFSYFLSSIMQPFWGYLADRQKKYYFMLLGLAITSVGIMCIFFIKNIYFLIFFILFANFGEGIYHPQATGFITRFSKHAINKNLGTFLSLGSLGFAIGPMFSGFLSDAGNAKYIIYAFLPALIICIFAAVKIFPLSNIKKPNSQFLFFEELKEIIFNKKLRMLVNIGFIRPLILVSLCIFMPFKWATMGYTNLKTGILLGLFSFVGALGAYVGGIVFTKYNKINCFRLSIIFTAICGLLYLKFIEYRFAVVFFFLTSFFVNLIASVNLSLAHKLIPKSKASISGLINGYNWGLVGITLWITGFFIAKFNYTTALGAILLIPLVFLFSVKTLFNKNAS